jgi:hypothetical protein
MTMIFDGDTRSFFILKQELKVEIAVPELLLKLAEKSQQVIVPIPPSVFSYNLIC